LELNDDLVATNVEVRAAITTAAPLDSHPFVALNTALNRSGVVIIAKKHVANPTPLHIMIINDARTGDVLHTPRVLVIAEEGASVEVIETHHTIGEHTALDVTVTELVAKAGSTITYTKLNADAGNGRHVGYTGGKIYRDAVINSHTFCLDGTFTRNDLNLQLMEPNASTYLNGVSVLNEQQFADNHTVVDHLVPHCHSEELYKGVYDGRSVGVFNGKIYVRPRAQKTTAYQSNHSLLLSDRASVNAKPQLEIFADDVKCSHGATMGQLDEEAVFYLQARGIGADEARALMTYAFAAEVIERLPHEELRAYLEQRVATKLGAHP
jgi:Fe-S cluster assembly protein SufD